MKKTTIELLELMKKTDNYEDYLASGANGIAREPIKIDRALNALIADKGLRKANVIARSGMEVHYAYQVFSGLRVPTRDKVVMLAFGMGLSAEETQDLLRVSGYAPLYAKTARDNAILFGLTKHLTVVDLNCLLDDLGLELLT